MQLQQGLRLIQQSYLAGGIMSGLIQSTSTEFFRGVSTSVYFYNAANTARTGYIQFNAGAASRISVEIVQPLALQ
jgi:hypothetical protein